MTQITRSSVGRLSSLSTSHFDLLRLCAVCKVARSTLSAFVGSCGLAFTIVSQANGQSAAETNSSVQPGYEVPAYGNDLKIASVYRKPSGGLVFEIVFTKENNTLTDFYDADENKLLAPNQERDLANNNPAEQRFRIVHSLERVNGHLILTLPDGTDVRSEDVQRRQCRWPYEVVVAVTPKSSGGALRPLRWMIFARLAVNETRSYLRNCDFISGAFKLTTRFRVQGEILYPDAQGGFYVQVSRFFIHFDALGQTSFFSGRSDVALVPADPVLDAAEDADQQGKASASAQQAYIDMVEREVDKIADNQMVHSR